MMSYNELISTVEWIHHSEHSCLLIHKNGSKSVRNALFNYYGQDNLNCYTIPNQRGMYWTVIRNPIDRVISGLAFDMKVCPTATEEQIIENIEKSLYGLPSPLFRTEPILHENHTFSQSCYLINNPIDFYVDISDLTPFLTANFNHNTSYMIDYDKSRENYNKAEEVINKFGMNRLKDLLAFDIYLYEKIMSSGNLWKWQHGKVFL